MSDTPRTDSFHDVTLSAETPDIIRSGWYDFACQLERDLADTQSRLVAMTKAEHALSDAYLRLRKLLNAFDTPPAPTSDCIWSHTESKLLQLKARLARYEQAAKELPEYPNTAGMTDLYGWQTLTEHIKTLRDTFAACRVELADAKAQRGTLAYSTDAGWSPLGEQIIRMEKELSAARAQAIEECAKALVDYAATLDNAYNRKNFNIIDLQAPFLESADIIRPRRARICSGAG